MRENLAQLFCSRHCAMCVCAVEITKPIGSTFIFSFLFFHFLAISNQFVLVESRKEVIRMNQSSANPTENAYISYIITFISGASFGLTTVVLGQPLDTVKTRMQGLQGTSENASAIKVLRDLYSSEGLKGLYRGGLPLLIGGSFMRSAQFGVSAEAKDTLEKYKIPKYNLFGVDSNILLSGIAGGLGRAMIEIPTDFLKIRKQVSHDVKAKMTWSMVRKNVLDGSVVTFSRNTLLFSSFIVYVDLSKQACRKGLVPSFLCVPDGTGLSPFAKGAICANLAWITCWPMDVIKTQRQSGNYSKNDRAVKLLYDNFKQGKMYKGILPGLARSTIANGSSMVVYEAVHASLSEFFQVSRKDLL